MKPLTISHYNGLRYSRWFLWFSVGFAVLYFILAINAYISGEGTWEWIFNIVIGCVWLIAGSVQFFGETNHVPEITLNDDGIKWKLRKSEKQIPWDDIQAINLTNNTIIIHSLSEEKEELSIAHLEYKELQTVKKRLSTLSETYDVSYSSKY